MKKVFLLLVGVLTVFGASLSLLGQQTSYKQTNLVANLPGVANNTDAQLSNSWGVAFIPGNPFWIADNNSGVSTLYDTQGNKQQLVVKIPAAASNPCNPGCPTGIVANPTKDFGGGAFLFDTEDGIVASWNGSGDATTAFDNSMTGAVYKGLALLTNTSGNFLLAANFRSAKIDVLDRNFKIASLAGTFTDPNLATGLAPHGVHVISNLVYVTYALQDAARHDPVNSAGNGVVDVFDLNGNFVKRLTSGGSLNSPWGAAMAPSTFGQFANDLLVGNFGDGMINAYDPNTGKFLGQLKDSGSNLIVNPGLWELIFGQAGTGDPDTLYVTAGGSDQTHGLFATLVPSQSVTAADFSLSLSQQSAAIPRGGTTSVTVNASGSGGFNSSIALSCTAPTGITCSFSPASITTGSGNSASTLMLGAASTAPTYSAMAMIMSVLLSFGIVGSVFCGGASRLTGTARWLAILGFSIVGLILSLALGCGSGGSKRATSGTPATGTPASVMVTGTSGVLSHSIPLPVTTN